LIRLIVIISLYHSWSNRRKFSRYLKSLEFFDLLEIQKLKLMVMICIATTLNATNPLKKFILMKAINIMTKSQVIDKIDRELNSISEAIKNTIIIVIIQSWDKLMISGAVLFPREGKVSNINIFHAIQF
jgi:hypothetical protein